MKKQKLTTGKLSLNKFKVTRLTKSSKRQIIGGNGINGTNDGGGDGTGDTIIIDGGISLITQKQ